MKIEIVPLMLFQPDSRTQPLKSACGIVKWDYISYGMYVSMTWLCTAALSDKVLWWEAGMI